MKSQKIIVFLLVSTFGCLFPSSILIKDIESAVIEGKIEIIEDLYQDGTLQYIAEEEPNLLHQAIRNRHYEIVELLLKANFNPNTREIRKDDSGRSPMYLAAESNNNAIVNLLRRYGASVTDLDLTHATLSHRINREMVLRNLRLVQLSQSS